MSVAEHWYHQGPVAPSWFGTLRTEDAAKVLWNLTGHHGDAVGIVRELERLRCEAVERTVDGMLRDLDAASFQDKRPE